MLLLNAKRLLLEHEPRGEQRILLAMEDISERRVAERQVEVRQAFLQHLLDALPSSVLLVQGTRRACCWPIGPSPPCGEPQWPVGQPLLDFLESHSIALFDSQGQKPYPLPTLATMRALHEGKPVADYQEVIHHADGTTLPVLVNAVPFMDQQLLTGLEAMVGNGQARASEPAALVVHQDVTRSSRKPRNSKISSWGWSPTNCAPLWLPSRALRARCSRRPSKARVPELAEWQHEAIAEIDLGADRLTRLTKDLLDVVRLQAGRLVFARERPRSGEPRAAGDRRPPAQYRAPSAHAPLGPGVSLRRSWYWVDGGRIEQVLSNLLTNAIKYSPDGGAIEVTLRKEEEQGSRADQRAGPWHRHPAGRPGSPLWPLCPGVQWQRRRASAGPGWASISVANWSFSTVGRSGSSPTREQARRSLCVSP